MRSLVVSIILFLIVSVAVISCSTKNETLSLPTIADYAPMAIGKTFLYRMDSVKTAAFGVKLDTVYYLAKDTVESKFMDITGRESYRIFRYVRDTMNLQPWRYAATYTVTYNSDNQWMEYIDNNLRFMKLRLPIKEGGLWQGNSFIDTRSASSLVKYLDGWNYEFQNVESPYTVRKGRFENTVTVFQQDETIPPGPFNPAFYQQRNYSIEVYAKGVGLIYKQFLHWTWQTTPPPSKFEDDSYGIRLNLLDYK